MTSLFDALGLYMSKCVMSSSGGWLTELRDLSLLVAVGDSFLARVDIIV